MLWFKFRILFAKEYDVRLHEFQEGLISEFCQFFFLTLQVAEYAGVEVDDLSLACIIAHDSEKYKN